MQKARIRLLRLNANRGLQKKSSVKGLQDMHPLNKKKITRKSLAPELINCNNEIAINLLTQRKN